MCYTLFTMSRIFFLWEALSFLSLTFENIVVYVIKMWLFNISPKSRQNTHLCCIDFGLGKCLSLANEIGRKEFISFGEMKKCDFISESQLQETSYVFIHSFCTMPSSLRMIEPRQLLDPEWEDIWGRLDPNLQPGPKPSQSTPSLIESQLPGWLLNAK